MKRQPRPFVVEVRKKRGDAARKQSIWAGLDLSAIAAETTERLKEVEPQHPENKAIEQLATEDVTDSTSTLAVLNAQINPDIDMRDLQHELTEEAAIERANPKASRRRRGSDETLSRGQRWKRRLPEVLRRKK